MKKAIIFLVFSGMLISNVSSDSYSYSTENLKVRTSFEETVGSAEYPDLNESQKLWMVALPAIIMSSNRSDLDTLEVETLNNSNRENWLNILSRDWGIDNREDLLATISDMEYSGHNDSFLSIRKLIIQLDGLSVEDIIKIEPLTLKKQNYYSFVLKNLELYKDINLIAWDLGRMTSLIRWGYQVGFLSENESWNMMLYFGNKIQKYYDSWEQYGEAYMLGRIFWASGFGKEEQYKAATIPIVEKLLESDGFWNTLSWSITLPEPRIRTLVESEIHELESNALEIDKMYNVSAHKYRNVYFDLGNYYYRNKNLDKAYDNFSKGLRLHADDWETQIKMAKIESLTDNDFSAYSRLEHIEKNANDPEILAMSMSIREVLSPVELKEIPPQYDKVLLIHAFDYIPDYILSALKSRISQEFKIRVWSGREELQLSEEDFRSPEEMLDRYIFGIVDDFAENRISDFVEILETLEMSGISVLSKTDKYTFVQYLYEQSENGREIWPDLINRMRPQYNADVLRKNLLASYSEDLKKPNVVGVLGVTLQDIYAQNYNFLFGWNGLKGAVMSINRFYSDNAPLTNIIKRSVNQSFSSTGFILGIPRCTVPNCARAYPNNLTEHDEKEDALCYECREALIGLYNRGGI